MAKQSVVNTNELNEYTVKFFDEGEHSVILLSHEDLIQVLQTGEWDGQEVSEIFLPINDELVTYNFLERDIKEGKHGWKDE